MADAFPMIARCIQKQPEAPIVIMPEQDMPPHQHDEVFISHDEYEEVPNLLVWSGSIHSLALTLKDDDEDLPDGEPTGCGLVLRTRCHE